MPVKALCLSGGGARGSFQLGAIKCIYEVYGFRPDVIGATSVGSVSGVLLATAPPPAPGTNNSQDILNAAAEASRAGGPPDAQLVAMHQLEQEWSTFLSPENFFSLQPEFQGTMVEDMIKDMNVQTKGAEPAVHGIVKKINEASDWLSAPIANLISGPVIAHELQKLRGLIETMFTVNSILNLDPVFAKLDDSQKLDLKKLANGTPLHLGMVSLETGKLRYVNGKGEFFERDGVTPVATALTDGEIDMALDDAGQPLAADRRAYLKVLVARYQLAVINITQLNHEYNTWGTTTARRIQITTEIARERERGNYCAHELHEQIKGVRVTAFFDPRQAVIASSCMPVYFRPPVVGGEQYVDGGVREIIPVEIVLSHHVDELVGIICSANTLPETDSMVNAGLIPVAARTLMETSLKEVVEGDMAAAAKVMGKSCFIMPTFDVHDTVVVQPSLIEISMEYGWMRASDEMQPAAAEQHEIFRNTSDLITRLRMKCLDLEASIEKTHFMEIDSLRADYSTLRVCRWAISQIANQRKSIGLPSHPRQERWSIDWEKHIRDSRTSSTIWSQLITRSSDNAFYEVLLEASSLLAFTGEPDCIQDAGSDRIFWIVRGAIFEDRVGTSLPGPLIVLPTGVHEFLPHVPNRRCLLAEVSTTSNVWLINQGKRYRVTSEQIAAAGLAGEAVALVPDGSLSQIEDGGVPYFLGGLVFVGDPGKPVAFPGNLLTEASVNWLVGSNWILDLNLFNQSANTITGITASLSGFDPSAGVSLENVPSKIRGNAADYVTLRLAPIVVGVFSGTLTINSSDQAVPTVPLNVRINVTPLGAIAELTASPSPLTVEARVNATDRYEMLTLQNVGGQMPTSLTVSIQPTEAEGVFRLRRTLNLAELMPGVAVAVPVFFYPTAKGQFDASLIITVKGKSTNNVAYERTTTVPLIGVAKLSTIRLLSPPKRGPLPAMKSWGNKLDLNIGTIQPPAEGVRSFYIGNSGTLPLEVNSYANRNRITTIGRAITFPLTIAPGQSVAIPIDIQGIEKKLPPGAFSDTLFLLSDDPVTPQTTVTINGMIAGASGAIIPEYINFGDVPSGGVVKRSAALTNLGTTDLKVKEIFFQSNIGFKLVNTPALPTTVAPGTSLALDIEFSAGVAQGPYTDRLVLSVADLSTNTTTLGLEIKVV